MIKYLAIFVDKIINNTATASTTATLLGLTFNHYQWLETLILYQRIDVRGEQFYKKNITL